MEPYYTDDRATLYKADALAVLAELPTASVDALITDPPYSSGGMVRGDRVNPDLDAKYMDTGTSGSLEAFSGDSRDAFGYWFWCSVWLSEAQRVLKPGAITALFTDWRQLSVTIGGIQSGGCVFRGVVPWHKPNGRPVQGRWANSCEYVVWGTNGPRSLDILGAKAFPGFFQAQVPRGAEREHLTQKPLSVMRDLVKIVPEDGIVLDLFAGSGTTGVAAVMEGRKFIGVEMTEHYAEVASNRLRTVQRGYRDDGAQAAFDLLGEGA
jgi:site-specific DNA-methyltransferase (adenine-specific)